MKAGDAFKEFDRILDACKEGELEKYVKEHPQAAQCYIEYLTLLNGKNNVKINMVALALSYNLSIENLK